MPAKDTKKKAKAKTKGISKKGVQVKDLAAKKAPKGGLDIAFPACDGSVRGVMSPRDPQSGLPTGQRQHKPFSL